MPTYTKRPVEIEAFQYGVDCIPDWFMDKVTDKSIILHKAKLEIKGYCEIQTLEGVMRGNHGDYIIRGIKGEVYPCRADIFLQTYTAGPKSAEPVLDWPYIEARLRRIRWAIYAVMPLAVWKAMDILEWLYYYWRG